MTRRLVLLPAALALCAVASCTSTSAPSALGTTAAGPTSATLSSTPASVPPASTGPVTSASTGTTASASSTATAGKAFVPTVDFNECDAQWNPTVDLSGFRCATPQVPLDWGEPTGSKIKLAIVEHPATDPTGKLGTLFFNPGGPGGTASVQFTRWYSYFPAELRRRFDIVSWDPRGIGQSTAVQCYDTADDMATATDAIAGYPRDTAAQQPYFAAMAAIGARCGKRNGDLLDHVTTTDTARDLEGLRQALGGQPLNYLGISYGTFLGATYANLFPDHIRSMVLDGNLDPHNWFDTGDSPAASLDMRIGSDRGVNQNQQAFLERCGQQPVSACAFSAGSAAATRAKWRQLLLDVAKEPVQTKSGRTYDDQTLAGSLGDAMDIVTPDAVAGSQGWSGTAVGIQNIWSTVRTRKHLASTVTPGSAGATTTATAATAGKPAAQRYSGPEGTWAVVCSDAAVPPASAWPAIGNNALATYGQAAANEDWGDLICATWPARPRNTYRGPWNTATSATILLIGNTDDPSTPYTNTRSMATTLSRTATITVNGYGHTMLLNPSSCGARHEVAYFVDGTLPPAGTTCEQDHQPFAP